MEHFGSLLLATMDVGLAIGLMVVLLLAPVRRSALPGTS